MAGLSVDDTAGGDRVGLVDVVVFGLVEVVVFGLVEVVVFGLVDVEGLALGDAAFFFTFADSPSFSFDTPVAGEEAALDVSDFAIAFPDNLRETFSKGVGLDVVDAVATPPPPVATAPSFFVSLSFSSDFLCPFDNSAVSESVGFFSFISGTTDGDAICSEGG